MISRDLLVIFGLCLVVLLPAHCQRQTNRPPRRPIPAANRCEKPGNFPVNRSCRLYLSCGQSNEGEVMSCPVGTTFNSDVGSCDNLQNEEVRCRNSRRPNNNNFDSGRPNNNNNNFNPRRPNNNNNFNPRRPNNNNNNFNPRRPNNNNNNFNPRRPSNNNNNNFNSRRPILNSNNNNNNFNSRRTNNNNNNFNSRRTNNNNNNFNSRRTNNNNNNFNNRRTNSQRNARRNVFEGSREVIVPLILPPGPNVCPQLQDAINNDLRTRVQGAIGRGVPSIPTLRLACTFQNRNQNQNPNQNQNQNQNQVWFQVRG